MKNILGRIELLLLAIAAVALLGFIIDSTYNYDIPKQLLHPVAWAGVFFTALFAIWKVDIYIANKFEF